MKKSNKKKLVVTLILVLLIMIIGASYAAFNYSFIGGVNTISSSEISIDLLESNSEIINITNALPMGDNDGKTQTDTFDFAVTSKTPKTTVIGYILNIEKLTVDSGYTSLNDSDIKIYLEDYAGNQLLEPTLISDLDNYKFYSNLHSHDTSHVTIQDKFKLRAWINPENVNAFEWDENTKLQYKFKIGLSSTETTPLTVNAVVSGGTITGSTSKSVTPGGSATFTVTPTNSTSEAVVSCTNSQTGVVRNNRLIVNNVTNNTTCTVTYTPASTVWYTDGTLIINERPSDRSANISRHGAVHHVYEAMSESNEYIFDKYYPDNMGDMVWGTAPPWMGDYETESDQGNYTISSVEIGQRIQPISTAWWCADLSELVTGDFTNLDTSEVTDMAGMFMNSGDNIIVLTGLNNFDTSQVTDMSNMFNWFGGFATTWDIGDLSNWDTSKVTNMSAMFAFTGYSATTWSVGDLSNWNTSSVTNMSSMFDNAAATVGVWNIGDLSDWDTSQVTNMDFMFYGTAQNATTWNSIGTLKVYATSIHQMFGNCPYASATLNIYSNPTSYEYAFDGAATESGALITVNYGCTTGNIDNIIATKSSNSNVVKGVQLD